MIFLLPCQEAVGIAGGMAKLQEGLRCRRILRGKEGNIPMFFFPRREYAKEDVYKQNVSGQVAKFSEDLDDLDKLQADQSWDADLVVTQGLEMGAFPSLPAASSSSAPSLTFDDTPGACAVLFQRKGCVF